MTKKLFVVLSVLITATVLLAACAPAPTAAPTAAPTQAPTAAPTEAPTQPPVAAPIKVCMVSDSGGLGDKSFNDLSWAGVQQGMTEFGVEGKVIESTGPSDFDPNLTACADEGAKLIICVGFMMTDNCAAAARGNPDIYYAGVDMAGFDLPNFRGVTAKMDESTFLAGYLAAGMTQTGKVGWYVGIMGPPVQIFGDGYFYGVAEYNKAHTTTVEVLGYDANDPGKALQTGSWIDADKGRSVGTSLMDEGADIILPVNGGVGAATAAVMQERGKGFIFGVDQDWTLTYPQYSAQILASVLKKIDIHVYDAVKRVATNTWEGGDFVLTLANGGTDLAYNPAVTVPAALAAEVADIKAKIIAGTIVIPAPKPIQ